MKSEETGKPEICANAGCRNAVPPESEYCEACELEWHLYRRDLRPPATGEAGSVRPIRRAPTP